MHELDVPPGVCTTSCQWYTMVHRSVFRLHPVSTGVTYTEVPLEYGCEIDRDVTLNPECLCSVLLSLADFGLPVAPSY